jgi:long-chain acyl-CoA synthetase
MLTWAALRAEIRVDAEGFRLSSSDRVLVTSSLDSSCAFVDMAMSALFAGARVVQCAFDPDAILDLIERERITMWGGGPTQVRGVVEAQRSRRRDVDSLRLVWVGGDKATAALRDTALEVLGRPIVDHYGITEAGLCLGSSPELARIEPGSCGTPWPGMSVRLVDEDDRDVGPDTIGEFVFRSATVMSGYWRNPEGTRRRLRDGWYRSGDLGRRDAAGRYWFVARMGDTFKRDGVKISALEVESALERHPGVLEAGVIGVPDGDLGDKARAYVTVRPGTTLGHAELEQFLADKLGDLWRPKEYVFVESLPKTPVGKVDRGRLRELAGLGRAR